MADVEKTAFERDRKPAEVFCWRAVVSTFMAACFAAMALSGALLFVAPRGRAADWLVLGLDKHDWQGLHLAFGLLLMVAGIFHIWLNFDAIKGYARRKISRKTESGERKIKIRIRPEPIIALALCAALAAAAIAQVPPASWITDMRDSFRGGGGEGAPPWAGGGN